MTRSITAYTCVTVYGHTVKAFYISDTEGKLPAVKDFTAANAYRRFKGKTPSTGVTAIARCGNGVMITVDPFLFRVDFSIHCKNSLYSFTKADITEVKTEVADSFGTYCEDGIRYRMYVPQAKGPRPLVLFLHGGGESGTDNETQLLGTYGPTAWAERFPECYVMAPQASLDGFYIPLRPYEQVEGDEFARLAPRNAYDFKFPGDYAEIGWGRTLLADICHKIRLMIAEGKVDPNRVYVTGMSMGGAGTIRAFNVDRELFAAAVPICPFMSDEIANELADAGDLPIWVTNAYLDNLFDRSKYLIDGVLHLMDAGNTNAHLTMFSKKEIEKYGFGTEPDTDLQEQLGLNHNAAWVLTYSNEHGIMDWLMSQYKH